MAKKVKKVKVSKVKRIKKIDAKSIKEVKKEDVEKFVREVIKKDGFPTVGTMRYVYYDDDGYIYATEEFDVNTYVVMLDGKHHIFTIISLEDYIYSIFYPCRKYGLSWNSTMQDWIEAYINDLFKNWNIEDYY